MVGFLLFSSIFKRIMSQDLPRFRFDDESNAIWTVTFITCFFIMIFTIFLWILIMQQFYCIPKSAYHSKFYPKHIKTYSTLTVSFATLSVIANCSSYPLCTVWDCWNTNILWVYNIVFWFFYTNCKIFLYLIFIARLFNPHYHGIYPYPKYIQYLLWTLLVILVSSMTTWFIAWGLEYEGFDTNPIGDTCRAVYGNADILLAVFLSLLFFQPICTRSRNHPDFQVAKRYGIISAMQLVAAVSFQLSFTGGIYLHMVGASQSLLDSLETYSDIANIIQMLDCMLLMICIYIGFARKRTVCDFPLHEWQQ